MRGTNYTVRVNSMEAQDSLAATATAQPVDDRGTLSVNLQHQLGAFSLAVNFQVPLGLIVLLGPSGAGKSLTLRGIAGLLHPQQGHISVHEQVLFDSATGIDMPAQVRHIGYVPQHYALFPHLTVAENILFALPPPPKDSRWAPWLQWRQQRARRQARVAELLSVLELEGLGRRYPATLSGGQQQRVALARALAAQPRLLLLDEPFNALDGTVRERLRDTLKQFQRRFAIPIVLVTHDHAEAQQLADTIVVVQRGQVAQVGSVNDIFYSPRTPAVAQLVGQRNIFNALLAAPPKRQPFAPTAALRVQQSAFIGAETSQTTSQDIEGNGGYNWLPLPEGVLQGKGTGCIRTDEILVHRWFDGGVPPTWTAQGSAQWLAVLQEAQHYGHMVRLLIRPCVPGFSANDLFVAESTLEVYLSRGQWRDVEVVSGQKLVLEIPAKAVHLFESPANLLQEERPL
jgi:ABC-type sulfate/molybdate transport systems ATPase subunit